LLSAKYYDPFALVFVAIPLETFVHSLRTVVGLTGIAVLRVLMQELRATIGRSMQNPARSTPLLKKSNSFMNNAG
jgi:hypothetical protein